MSAWLRNLRAWVWNAGAFLFFAGLLVSALVYGGVLLLFKDGSICKITHTQELASPNGKKLAKLGYSDCGATTHWQSGLSIEDAATGKEFTGFFGLDGKPDGIKLRWENEYTLVISGFEIEKVLWLKQDNFSGVRVVLKP